MSIASTKSRVRKGTPRRRGGLSEKDFAQVDPFIQEALSENKRQGLLLAVRARWVALATIAVLLPSPQLIRWEVLYYEVALIVFAPDRLGATTGGQGRAVPAGTLPDLPGPGVDYIRHRIPQSVP